MNQKLKQPTSRMSACCERVAAMNLRQLRLDAPAKQQPQQAKQKSHGRCGTPLRVDDRVLRAGGALEPAGPERSEGPALPVLPAGTVGGRRDIAQTRGL